MDDLETLRRDIDALHRRMNTQEQTAPAPQRSAPSPAGMPDGAAIRKELARLSQIADQYAELKAAVAALSLRAASPALTTRIPVLLRFLLSDADYRTDAQVRAATDAELDRVPGLGAASIRTIRAAYQSGEVN